VKLKLHIFIFSIVFFIFCPVFGQNVSLYSQFNGRYDFTFIGNTMNVAGNGANDPCVILTSSSANLNLNINDDITAAYLYWAGSGTGDFDVQLNGLPIVPERTFSTTQSSNGNPFFSAFTDVTTIIQTLGNINYTLSELDITSFLNPATYCNNGTNFAGWAIVVVYRNNNLPLNQLNIYDGLEALSTPVIGTLFELTINLPSLNVIDNAGAKLGFVAWEGDATIANEESLRINGNLISAPPLNPSDNIFNGTNSITNNPFLFNMDLDIFDIQNNINIGDSSAEIKLTTAQDFVLINTIVTKLNSQLPDATIVIDAVNTTCNTRLITVDFTVNNFNATADLITGVPISIYVNGIFFQSIQTTLPIAIGGSWSSQISMLIPDDIPSGFTLQFNVDDDGNGNGIATEYFENNNSYSVIVTFKELPEFNALDNVTSCNEGLTKGTFDFSGYADLVKVNPTDSVRFYASQLDAESGSNPILNTSNYVAITTPKEIFVRIDNAFCTSITSFLLLTKNCPPIVYNYVSSNGDGMNDSFFIEGLRDIFVNFELSLYNRWGRLIWTGNNQSEDWDGFSNKGYRLDENNSPKSTYYYILYLNDADYPEPLSGYLYYTK
jgi:gliding motility-associated-like protein